MHMALLLLCLVPPCSQEGLYGLGTFSAIFGPEMAEAILGRLIVKFDAHRSPYSWCVLMQLGSCSMHTQILGPATLPIQVNI